MAPGWAVDEALPELRVPAGALFRTGRKALGRAAEKAARRAGKLDHAAELEPALPGRFGGGGLRSSGDGGSQTGTTTGKAGTTGWCFPRSLTGEGFESLRAIVGGDGVFSFSRWIHGRRSV